MGTIHDKARIAPCNSISIVLNKKKTIQFQVYRVLPSIRNNKQSLIDHNYNNNTVQTYTTGIVLDIG